jgi:hypothetical protein
MVSQSSRRTSLNVDPLALLKREHRMILDRLAMVETAMSPRSSGSGAVKGTNRETLRELLEFFTGPVDVHFKREAMLVGDLRRILGRKQEEQEQFQSFLDEHRALKADARAVMRAAGKKADRRSRRSGVKSIRRIADADRGASRADSSLS